VKVGLDLTGVEESRVAVEWWSETAGTQIALLAISVLLCGIIGLERQVSQKSAGIRTHTLVGMGAAGFTLVSAYGFANITGSTTAFDPSRIAAQIVSGIGFLGAGVIFMRRDVVRGLTTAATIWVSAAIGMACGAGMVALAVALTVFQLLALVVLAPLGQLLPTSSRNRTVEIRYLDGRGVLREVLRTSSEMGFHASISHARQVVGAGTMGPKGPSVAVSLQFRGLHPLNSLVAELTQLDDVQEVRVRSSSDEWDD
jgi:putative Mg2+ transporter-C (MgtC) family protein